MALRNVVHEGDEILRKRAREVGEINERILQLLDDMAETMKAENGVGLAAPQVGILKRIFIVDIGEGLMELINPEILESSGCVAGDEGCLSVPGLVGSVERPEYIKIAALDRNGDRIVYEGHELLARVFCHENDHLDGVLYVDKATDIRSATAEDDEEY